MNDKNKGRYEALASDIGQITDEKARLYGDSAQRAEDILQTLYPSGIPVESFRNALLVVRIADKLCRIATAADGDAEDPWLDLVGYSLIGAMRTGVKR